MIVIPEDFRSSGDLLEDSVMVMALATRRDDSNDNVLIVSTACNTGNSALGLVKVAKSSKAKART